MATNIAEAGIKRFNAAVERFTKQLVPEKQVLFQRRMVMEALTRIVRRTPVKTGRARGNWQTTIGSPASGEVNVIGAGEQASKGKGARRGREGYAGRMAISNGRRALRALPPFSTVHLTNNVPYIVDLEMGRRSTGRRLRGSVQAPEGMVAVTMNEMGLWLSSQV